MIHEALAVKLALFFVIDACAYHDLISGSLKFQNLICNFTNGFIACIKSQGMKQLIAGGGVALVGTTLVPLLSSLF